MIYHFQKHFNNYSLLGLEGTPEEIAIEGNVLYNFKITNTEEPHFIKRNFAYVFTTPKMLFNGFCSRFLNELQHQSYPRIIKNGQRQSQLPDLAANKAQNLIANMIYDTFFKYRPNSVNPQEFKWNYDRKELAEAAMKEEWDY